MAVKLSKDTIKAKHKAFPRGLTQTDNMHFSLDSLLLAAFASNTTVPGSILDLGCGCGIIGLGVLMRQVAAQVIGLDIVSGQIKAARLNAKKLGFAEQFRAILADIQDIKLLSNIKKEISAKIDLVLCNPPWRQMGAERMPKSSDRSLALYGDAEIFSYFCRAAGVFLDRGKSLAMIAGAYRLFDLLSAMHKNNFSPFRLIFVHPRPKSAAKFILIEARYGVGARLSVEPALILHQENKKEYTDEALRFCPWLNA